MQCHQWKILDHAESSTGSVVVTLDDYPEFSLGSDSDVLVQWSYLFIKNDVQRNFANESTSTSDNC